MITNRSVSPVLGLQGIYRRIFGASGFWIRHRLTEKPCQVRKVEGNRALQVISSSGFCAWIQVHEFTHTLRTHTHTHTHTIYTHTSHTAKYTAHMLHVYITNIYTVHTAHTHIQECIHTCIYSQTCYIIELTYTHIHILCTHILYIHIYIHIYTCICIYIYIT